MDVVRRSLAGVRPADVVVTVLLVALAVVLGVENATAGDVATRIDSHSWWQVPVLALAALPVLWWRRAPVAALGVAIGVTGAHDLLFGHLVRCGAGLPLAFTFAFVIGLGRPWRVGLVGVPLTVVLAGAVLVWDTAAGPELLPVVAVILAGLWAIGQVARSRSALVAQLRGRNAELAELRERRAALEVADDRARVSRRLETVIDARLTDLQAAARDGLASTDPARTREVLAAVEDGSRETLEDMRGVVGVLRGDETLAPTPSVAELAALVEPRGELRIDGDPRPLPTGLELSVHRVVECLVDVLADAPVVTVRFRPDDVEIDVAGSLARGADVRGALARVRERVRLHAGSVDADIGRRRALVRARVPVSSG